MAEKERIHLLTEAIYRNILDNFNPGIRQLINTGRTYQKALHNVTVAAKSYIDSIYNLSESGQVCKGATSEIGTALLQIAEVQKEINTHVIENIKSFHSELLIPLDSKSETEVKQIQLLYKKYLAGHKYYSGPCGKAQAALKKQKKKTKNKFGFDQKEMQYAREVKVSQAKLDDFHLHGLRQVLMEERRRYCFLLDKVCGMVRNYASHHSKAQELLTHRLPEWSQLCKNPHILPDSSEAVLHAFKSQDNVYNTPNEVPNENFQHNHSREFARQPPNQDSSSVTYGSTPRRTHQNIEDSASVTYSHTHNGMVNHQEDHPSGIPRSMTVPAPPPQMRPQVRAVYSHGGVGDTQLSFKEGDFIALVGEKREGWQYGENTRTNRMGWFPVSFTEPVSAFTDQCNSLANHHRVRSLGNLADISSHSADYHHQTSLHSGNSDTDSVQAAPREPLPLFVTDRPISVFGAPPPGPFRTNLTNKYPGSVPDVNMLTHPTRPPVPPPDELPLPPPPPPPSPGPRSPMPYRGASTLPHMTSSPAIITKQSYTNRTAYESSLNQYSEPVYVPRSQATQGSSGYSSNTPSPGNSSSGYSGNNQSRHNDVAYQYARVSAEFPPPPPNLAPPAPPTSDYEDEQPRTNPFAQVTKKKKVPTATLR